MRGRLAEHRAPGAGEPRIAGGTSRERALRWLERGAIALASLALSSVLIALASGYFAAHDRAALAPGRSQLGRVFADQGDVLLAAGAPAPRYDSDPPTSGPHRFAPVRRDQTPLSDSQLLTALAAGDVVVFYGARQPPSGLRALARALGPFSRRLAAAGEAVILAPRPGTRGLLAAAWTRLLAVRSASDPALRAFVEAWLGRGAGRGG
jgi:hypothetical protein